MTGATQLRSCGKLSAAGPPSTFPQPPQLRRRRTNVLTMSLDDSVSYLPGTYTVSGISRTGDRRIILQLEVRAWAQLRVTPKHLLN